MKKNTTEKQNPKKQNLRRPPSSIFIWLLVLVTMVTLIILNSSHHFSKSKEWTTDEFVTALNNNQILTAEITPESLGILSVVGTYHSTKIIDSNKISIEGANEKEAQKNNIVEEIDLNQSLDKKSFDVNNAHPIQGIVIGNYSTKIFATEKIINELQTKHVKVTYVQQSFWWKELVVNILIFAGILFLGYFFFVRQIRGAGRDAQLFGKSRAKMIPPNANKTKFDDVAGCDEAKEETKEIVDFLKDPLKYQLVGGHIPHGALLTGPPGTGKTLMARAVSGEAGVPFFSISGSDFVEMFVGVGASRVRDMFQQARAHAPSVIFIDEIDAVGRSRFSGIGGGHDEREQTLNAMLVEMDGLEQQESVIVLAATNRPDVLDPALLRPGRFDRQIVFSLPDIKGRRKILDVHVKKIRLDESVDLDVVAKGTTGFSGADISNLVNEAALLAARNNHEKATMNDFEEARDKVCFGPQRRSVRIPEHDRKLTAFHEAGHALTNIFLEHSVPLHKVTIIPRGRALGLTMMMEHEDKFSQSKGEMLDNITMSLGGRVAEELTMGDISSGASQDIAHATNIAHAMVCSFGMSEKIGTIQYGERGEHIYLGRDITRNEACSEETQREIDLEIKKIIEFCKNKATQILTEQKARLELLANALLEKETLSADEVYELLEIPKPLSKTETDTDVDVDVGTNNSIVQSFSSLS